jgi:hypothetical protein
MNRKISSIILVLALLLTLTPSTQAEVLQEIVVREGDTLWSVANYYLKDPQRWPEIVRYNKLPSSDLNVILPGMRLRVPILLLKEHLRSAHLVYLLNDVRYRRKTSAEWQKAQLEMELYNEDGLRTLDASRAKVKFPSGETLQMDENSLIILKPEQKREEIDLLSGGVRASRTRVLASSTIIDPKIEPKGPAPDFRTKVKEDKTTLVEVFEGIVDVTAQGKTVTLTKGFGTSVKFREAPSLPQVLPPQPSTDIAIPASGAAAQAPAAGEPPRIASGSSFTITLPDPVTRSAATSGSGQPRVMGQMIAQYHLQVATTSAFAPLVLEETKPFIANAAIDLKDRQFPDGHYYYRIAYIDKLGFEGQFSAASPFTVDTTPPLLELTSLKDGDQTDGEFIHVEGKSEPGANLTVNNRPVTPDDTGKFVTALYAAKGLNRIVVTAADRAGNAVRRELVVEKVAVLTKKSSNPVAKTTAKTSKLASIALGTLTAGVIVGVLVLIVR